MHLSWKGIFLIGFLLFAGSQLNAQQLGPYDLVDPMIGTDYSEVLTKWGSEGGTYPGAVAPFGYIQLSPETGTGDHRGYHYQDSSIYYFSCMQHHSGYPSGSSGSVWVMPVSDPALFEAGKSVRPFSHQQEEAMPGYYQLSLSDDGTRIEATASVHSGIFRFHFPQGVVPHIFIGDAGEMHEIKRKEVAGDKRNTLFQFSENYTEKRKTEKGTIYTFRPEAKGTTLTLKLSSSSVSLEASHKNLEASLGKQSFEQVRAATASRWKEMLSVVSIEDDNIDNQRKFYTALYHSLLMPWIISDLDGRYRGRDQQIHQAEGAHTYGGFSAWDTYRTQHPLLTLLFPEIQKDMLLSMLQVYDQTGFLPLDPMTGNHSVPIVVDSYLKGVQPDSSRVFQAMLSSIHEPPYAQQDLLSYQQLGYLPATFSESVTRTVEYAYDDWALSRFAQQVMQQEALASDLLDRSLAYRKLFNPATLLMQPKKEDSFITEPPTLGYKEGDAWVYSYAVPFQPRDLINLMGGDTLFAQRLHSALEEQRLVFDNETVLHVPYLFTYAHRPDLTQYWASEIMNKRFLATPGGLPGNDDLGSMSSWFVFSALGFYPTAPGRPTYDLGTPLFESATINLPNKRTFTVRSSRQDTAAIYVQQRSFNAQPYQPQWISHAQLLAGGELQMSLSHEPNTKLPARLEARQEVQDNPAVLTEINALPVFSLSEVSLSSQQLKSNEVFWIRYTIANRGSTATRPLTLYVDGKAYKTVNSLVAAGTQRRDSIACQLYTPGTLALSLDEKALGSVEVQPSHSSMEAQFDILSLQLKPTVAQGNQQYFAYILKNIGWESYTFQVPIYLDGSLLMEQEVQLPAGESKRVEGQFETSQTGMHTLSMGQQAQPFKLYASAEEASVLSLSLDQPEGSTLPDASGFQNDGQIVGSGTLFDGQTYVRLPTSPSLQEFDSTLSLMGWLKLDALPDHHTDLISLGDHHVMQLTADHKLNFFAGGWGRGECSIALPEDFVGTWHQLVGVCDGRNLYLYIDGKLQASTPLAEAESLSFSGAWAIGSNEEFPGERLLRGEMADINIFSHPLPAQQIRHHYQQSASKFTAE